jgi:hypothetical protein
MPARIEVLHRRRFSNGESLTFFTVRQRPDVERHGDGAAMGLLVLPTCRTREGISWVRLFNSPSTALALRDRTETDTLSPK